MFGYGCNLGPVQAACHAPGGIAYHHIADNYIALFTTFIPCGVWEAVHILDGLLKNRSTIQMAISPIRN